MAKAPSGLLSKIKRIPNAFYILIIALFYFMFTVRNFASPANLGNLIVQSCILVLLSASLSWVLMSGNADLSIGATVSLSGVVIVKLLTMGWSEPLAILAGLLVGAGFGLLNGIIVVKMKIPAFIGTFGMMGVGKGLANLFSDSRSIYLTDSVKSTPIFNFLNQPLINIRMNAQANGVFSLNAIPLVTVVILFLLIWTFRKTAAGNYIYAIGGNAEAARLNNIKVDTWSIGIYVMNGLIAAVAGILMVVRLNSAQPTSGDGLEFQATVAAVLGGNSMAGGIGSVGGAIVGGLIVYVIRNGLNMGGVNSNAIMVVTGAILIISMLADLLAKQNKKISKFSGKALLRGGKNHE